MRAFIPCKDGVPLNANFYAAWLGFKEMGFEIIEYFDRKKLEAATKNDIVVGGIGSCRFVLERLKRDIPSLNYPQSLQSYLGRRIWQTTINQVHTDTDSWPLFIKPVQDKIFTGKVVREIADVTSCGTNNTNPEVICSELVDFKAEWRVFVRYGEILDVRPYGGNWRYAFNPTTIEQAIKDFEGAPAGYGIDFGITADNRTLLVEVNDGYALGSYGLQHNLYAQLLSARWSELMGVADELACIGNHPGL